MTNEYAMNLTPSVSDEIYKKMLANISNGIWKEGQKIPSESVLCELFGASRVSIRGTIKLLQGQGFLVTRPGIGSFVSIPRNNMGIRLNPQQTTINVDTCRDFVDFRILAETEAIKQFAQRANDENFIELKTAVEGMGDSSQDAKEFLEHDISFHLAIFKGSHNQYLYNAMAANFNVMRDYIEMVLNAMEEPFQGKMYERHWAIYDDIMHGRINSAILRVSMELNYCYVEIFDDIKV